MHVDMNQEEPTLNGSTSATEPQVVNGDNHNKDDHHHDHHHKSLGLPQDILAEVRPPSPDSPDSVDTAGILGEDKRPLTLIRKACYGVGHVLNDLCAAMWFSYLLVFLHSVLNFTNTYAGAVILLGQVADAIATPFVGIESDHSVSGFFGYGRRKSWHLIGTIAVIVSFPFLFIDCIGCHNSHDWAKFIYFAPFVVIFQFGWASVQIAHLALIPDLSSDGSHRVELNAIRYGWTVISNLTVYMLTWLVLRMDTDGDKTVNPSDASTFRMIVFIVIGVGTLFSVIFHVGVKEDPHPQRSSSQSSVETQDSQMSSVHMTWAEWFKEPHFYIVGALYMSARLFVNLTQVYLPMYLLDTLQLGKDSIGYIPLMVYMTGFVASVIMKPLNRWIGKKVACVLGIALGLGACAWIQFFNVDGKTVYGIAALLGTSGTVLMVASLAVTSDLIAGSTSTGAFVFGLMSFADKLSNGLAVMAIQLLHPVSGTHSDHSDFFAKVMVYVPTGACVIALICILLISRQTVGVRHRDRQRIMSSTSYREFVNQNDEDRQAMFSESGDHYGDPRFAQTQTNATIS
ncbi:major facilitator superfamily domain-containing protein 12-like [Paramacrobiotus metropolitanus]|uniref:major facilitator superfamily domain-containing protein 12-like n=1 Tax=Paramacrobiotus metropolitanus TaxID=2943436 RepID=UPI002445CE70|nr:major facilitator superfamily domain-containing protein 12-like [Paramacrobiotus metropolitanus]XP_055342568.1 major facilitator superfamily domain-containing protein 12-like [Paramacrobiotus metropolitanus]